MASVKVKFRASTVEGKQGTIFYQVIHNRVVRQIKTGYRVYRKEWSVSSDEVILPQYDDERRNYLIKIKCNIEYDISKLQQIIASLNHQGKSYSSAEVISSFKLLTSQNSFFGFMEEVINELKKLGRIRTSETYTAALNSFRRFRDGEDLSLDKLEPNMILSYEAYLKAIGVSSNSSSFYMRNLRAVYNRAVERGIIQQQYPFKYVYTGVGKTEKRAVSVEVIKRINEMDLSISQHLDYARDMFMFSFYTRGMSLVDMAYLRKKDLVNGLLSYRRRKTGQHLFIKWEKPMQDIVDKYKFETESSVYLLPIIKPSRGNDRKQYIYAGHNINRNLKIIGEKLGLMASLTMYVARHSWASIAKSKNIPLSIISEGMGHNSETTTRIYLASLDHMIIDKANMLVIKSIQNSEVIGE
ncbi:site-specific integrase [Barnesiella sp. An55]|uniref:tyrosine-type recombinase/integrase n=1 Tax=Barnesiella sp. An55 TaxID=1965646 RepID=UPI000B389D5C|nr:site-specific integrase [Barnesiella sp. An55]OUN73759.1 integrase [Barnesiella sp. An55]